MPKCNTCGNEIDSMCEWRQGRCPHRKAMIDDIMFDNYKARFYNLLHAIKNIFKKD